MKLAIDNYIGGWDGISEKEIRENLASLKEGEDLELTINSPGGDVYEGIAIFNTIRETAKTHNVIVTVNGLAASMATYIALAARTVKADSVVRVSDNSIFMIHNPWTFSFGDYRDFEKTGNYLKQLAGVLCGVYSFVSKKEKTEVASLMDAETFFVGKEISDNGFANEFEETTKQEDSSEVETDGIESRDSLVVNAKLKIKNCYESLKKAYEDMEEKPIDKAAALLKIENTNLENSINENKNQNTNGGSMKGEELKVKDAACYNEIFALGEKSAIEKERERVSAHLRLAEKCGGYELAAKFIAEGKSTADADVQGAYMDYAMKQSKIQNRADDDPPATQTESGNKDADEAALIAEFDKGFFGKGE